MTPNDIRFRVREIAREEVDDFVARLSNSSQLDRLILLAEMRMAVDRRIVHDMHPSRRGTQPADAARLLGQRIFDQVFSEPRDSAGGNK